jgi:hypothetical protein
MGSEPIAQGGLGPREPSFLTHTFLSLNPRRAVLRTILLRVYAHVTSQTNDQTNNRSACPSLSTAVGLLSAWLGQQEAGCDDLSRACSEGGVLELSSDWLER